jgi:hypothetical protein
MELFFPLKVSRAAVKKKDFNEIEEQNFGYCCGLHMVVRLAVLFG